MELERGRLVRIEDGRGMLVRVTSGSVWVTEEGDSRDRIVTAGKRFRIGSGGVTLISAISPGTIALGSRTSQPSRLRARLLKWWKGMFVAGARPTTAAL
jgi:hypothetical protein